MGLELNDIIPPKKESMYSFIKGMHDKRKWESFRDYDSFVPFIINRILSANYDYVEMVDYFQKYLGTLEPEQMYNWYASMLPRTMPWTAYPKTKKKTKDQDIKLIAHHFQVSNREAEQYIKDYSKEDLKQLKTFYGIK